MESAAAAAEQLAAQTAELQQKMQADLTARAAAAQELREFAERTQKKVTPPVSLIERSGLQVPSWLRDQQPQTPPKSQQDVQPQTPPRQLQEVQPPTPPWRAAASSSRSELNSTADAATVDSGTTGKGDGSKDRHGKVGRSSRSSCDPGGDDDGGWSWETSAWGGWTESQWQAWGPDDWHEQHAWHDVHDGDGEAAREKAAEADGESDDEALELSLRKDQADQRQGEQKFRPRWGKKQGRYGNRGGKRAQWFSSYHKLCGSVAGQPDAAQVIADWIAANPKPEKSENAGPSQTPKGKGKFHDAVQRPSYLSS